MAGQHKSPFHGFSVEFLEYRSYLPGESTRAIDWRKYARTDRAVVRLFEDETNLRAWLLLDKSASMGLRSRSAPLSKLEYAKTLCASLAWILIRQRDATGLAIFDETVSSAIPPRSTNRQLKAILAALDGTEAGAATRCGAAINAVATRIVKRGSASSYPTFSTTRTASSAGCATSGSSGRTSSYSGCSILRSAPPSRTVRLPCATSRPTSGFRSTANRFAIPGRRDAARRTAIESACRELAIDLDIITTNEPFQKALLQDP